MIDPKLVANAQVAQAGVLSAAVADYEDQLKVNEHTLQLLSTQLKRTQAVELELQKLVQRINLGFEVPEDFEPDETRAGWRAYDYLAQAVKECLSPKQPPSPPGSTGTPPSPRT